ncbi:universal stress protein [bacterium]|nr:universal stress protein [bacterium]
MKENMRKVLVPVDFSSTSNKAFLYAREMADCWEGELHLVHVLDTEFLSGAVHITIEPLDESVAKWEKRAEEKLKSIYHEAGGEALSGEIHIRKGKPPEEILQIAEELDVDMIVIGSHGRTGLERAIFGSVAEKVTRLAQVPVLVIK